MFQTDSDEDVVFVFERCANKPIEITIDQVKRLALQRDIDQQSQPKEPAKPLSSERLVAEERQAEMVKMKMEEEKSEENPIKKEKKHKKGQANDGSLAEVKKDPKKGKMADALVNEEGSWDGRGEKGEQKKKKKETDSLTVSNGSEVTDRKAVNKKKKNNKLLADIETQVETQSLIKEEEVEKKQKKMKAKNKCTQIKQESTVNEKEEEQQVGKDNLPKKVKKGKKNTLDMSTEVTKEQMKKKKLADGETQLEVVQGLVKEEDVEKKQKKKVKNKSSKIKCENVIKKEEEERQVEKDNPPKKVKGKERVDVSTEVTEEHIKEKKKKHKRPLTVDGGTVTTKKKAKVAENGIKLETAEYENEDVKRKKKKKESKTKGDGNEVETTEIKGKTKKSKAGSDKIVKSEKQENSTNTDIVSMNEGKTEQKKKAKKDKCKIATMEVAKIEEAEPKKKKRKKINHEEEPLLIKSKEVQEGEQRRGSLSEADDAPKKKSKKKKSSAQVEHVSDAGVEPVVKKKKKIKQEQEDPGQFPQVDVVFLSERSGNTDEITINQERRQALQMEIDKASQPEKTVKPTGFGQWSTAQFSSSEQQQKFLRLMGGFKKGFQPAGTSTGGANMALGKDAQQQLQQSLLGEFERAQSRRMDFNNRGAGLGFTAPSDKKFSIDINACRSVRFDD